MTYARPHQDRPVVRSGAVVEHDRALGAPRLLQIVAGLCGGALFAFGLVSVFRVDFGSDWLRTTATVAGFDVSAAVAIASLVMGGIILVATLADEDRGSAATVGLLTLVLGIVGLVLRDNPDTEVQVAGRTASLFVVLGAVVFVLSLVPWWSRRRATTYVDERYEA